MSYKALVGAFNRRMPWSSGRVYLREPSFVVLVETLTRFKSYIVPTCTHPLSVGNVAPAPVSQSPHVEGGKVLDPELPPVPGHVYSVQWHVYSAQQHVARVTTPHLDTVLSVCSPPVTISVSESGSGMEQASLNIV